MARVHPVEDRHPEQGQGPRLTGGGEGLPHLAQAGLGGLQGQVGMGPKRRSLLGLARFSQV